LPQYLHVVVIKRGFQFLEAGYGIVVEHLIFFNTSLQGTKRRCLII
jgi:hypothetical protein